MAYQIVKLNVQENNPYNFVLASSATLATQAIGLAIDLAQVTNREQVLLALDQFKLIFSEVMPAQQAVLPP